MSVIVACSGVGELVPWLIAVSGKTCPTGKGIKHPQISYPFPWYGA